MRKSSNVKDLLFKFDFEKNFCSRQILTDFIKENSVPKKSSEF